MKKKNKAPEYPKVSESFQPPYLFGSTLTLDSPTAMNGDVRIRKYRTTIEIVDEPKEVLAARLQKLWDECDNFHHWGPLEEMAKEIGYTPIGDIGKKKPKRL